MKIKCQECNTLVEIDENEYKKGVEHITKCPLCDEEIHFTIQEEAPEPEPLKVTPPKENKDAKPLKETPKKVPVREHKGTGTSSTTVEYPVETSSNSGGSNLKGILIGIFVVALLVGGYLYYDKVYLPEKIDAEAPRTYTIANALVLRSSKVSGTDYNKLATMPYGTELITYNKDSEWAEVKLKGKGSSDDLKGYVSSAFLLPKADFFLLHSIFGNSEARETVSTTKCRLALLQYYKNNGIIGKLEESMRKEAGIGVVPNSTNQWQVFTKHKDAKPNTVYYKRLINKSSKFTDFAVIITNIKSGERKLLYFYFDDDETPHLATEFSAPQSGDIQSMESYTDYSGNIVINANYSY